MTVNAFRDSMSALSDSLRASIPAAFGLRFRDVYRVIRTFNGERRGGRNSVSVDVEMQIGGSTTNPSPRVGMFDAGGNITYELTEGGMAEGGNIVLTHISRLIYPDETDLRPKVGKNEQLFYRLVSDGSPDRWFTVAGPPEQTLLGWTLKLKSAQADEVAA